MFVLREIPFLGQAGFEALISALCQCTQRNLPVTQVGCWPGPVPTLMESAGSYAEYRFTFYSIGVVVQARIPWVSPLFLAP